MQDPEWIITSLTNTAAQQYPGGLRAIHKEMPGRAYSTLSGDVNPGNAQARLKTGDMIRIMKVTGDIEPLRYLAALFGYRLHSMRGNEPDAPTMFEEFHQDSKAKVDFEKTGVAYRAGKVSLTELLAARDAYLADVDQSFSRIVNGDEEDGS